MQFIIGIVVGIAISIVTIIALRLIRWIKYRNLENQLERLVEQAQPVCANLGMRRYKEDGSYTGGKTTILTDWAIQKERELSERSENSDENQK